jgi:hypothetical protein|tara:strand:+ start:157 stop:330 length:174 start_codon:yes stop_codon:yes gene_type:complete
MISSPKMERPISGADNNNLLSRSNSGQVHSGKKATPNWKTGQIFTQGREGGEANHYM